MGSRPEIRDRSDYRRAMNERLLIDPARTVVLTIDMQRDYLDMEVATSPVAPDEATRVIASATELLDVARARDIPVIHVYVSRRAIELEWGLDAPPYGMASRQARLSQNAQAPARKGPSRLQGSPQAEVPAALVAPTDLHVRSKRVTDAYHNTELDMLLGRAYKPETVVLTGINTDTCVYATTFSTACRGYQPVVISDCVASARGEDSHWMALELMSRSVAWVLSVAEFRSKVEATAAARA